MNPEIEKNKASSKEDEPDENQVKEKVITEKHITMMMFEPEE